ncbi:hypothetical protein DGM85_12175 [Xanthomonas phaseoli pv. phaseoli]|nr:hypothetical protein DGM93_11960 [Xanthomonas phaseoli pv. phaseoli]QWN29148.1 hypothetical protein DGM85_12175 [Xanthomonas phaseoli pv. phaseoli]QWN33253.1 hypothetical protein DGM81_11710 [Xanthomonas phaseoli pv. phaseoli]
MPWHHSQAGATQHPLRTAGGQGISSQRARHALRGPTHALCRSQAGATQHPLRTAGGQGISSQRARHVLSAADTRAVQTLSGMASARCVRH